MRNDPSRTSWIGAGVIAALVAPPIAAILIAVANLAGMTNADLRSLPAVMVFLWGTVGGFILAGPVAFALAAGASESARRGAEKGRRNRDIVWGSAAGVAAAAGATHGAVLKLFSVATGELGWVLVPVGTVTGAIIGALAARMTLSDRDMASSGR